MDKPIAVPTLESLNERLIDLEMFMLAWMNKAAEMQAATLDIATDSNKTARLLLDIVKGKQDEKQQQLM